MGATNPNAGGAPGGGGKGGMGMNRGPGGNAQNNPGGYPPGMMPGPNMPGNPINATANSVGQSMGGSPMGNWQSMMQKFPGYGSGGPSWASMLNQHGFPGGNFGGGNPNNDMGKPDGFGGGLALDKGYFKPSNLSVPTPQPQEPIGGYINGQPAQFHHQAMALNKPQPQTTAAGLPAGGLLARLDGG